MRLRRPQRRPGGAAVAGAATVTAGAASEADFDAAVTAEVEAVGGVAGWAAGVSPVRPFSA